MPSRSMRRHHEKRIKRRVRSYYGGYAANSPRQLGRLAHARQSRSCWMCGNPRRRQKTVALAERVARDAEPNE